MNYKVNDTVIAKENPYIEINTGDELKIRKLYCEGVGGRKGAWVYKKDNIYLDLLLWEDEFDIIDKTPTLGDIAAIWGVEPDMSTIRPKETPLQEHNPMYCNCGSTDIVKNMAASEVFVYCRACKKERL